MREPYRILLVDDDEDMRVMLRHRLVELGHAVQSTGSAKDPLERARAMRPDLVVLDWKLEDGSGVGLSNMLRLQARTDRREIRIVVLSRVLEPSAFRDNESIDGYMTKRSSQDQELLIQHMLPLCRTTSPY